MKKVITGILILILIVCLWINAGNTIIQAINCLLRGPEKDYSQYTIPLSLDRQRDLCKKFAEWRVFLLFLSVFMPDLIQDE
jgi:hypothetical protein